MTRTYVVGESSPSNPWKTDTWVFLISDIREEQPIENEDGTTTRQWSFVIDNQYTYKEYMAIQEAIIAEHDELIAELLEAT